MAQTTKRALGSSLKKLLRERSLDHITVKDLVEDCEVNRQTFYYHFQDLYDLLRWVFEEEAKQVVADQKDAETWREGYLRAFQYARENRGMVLHVYRSNAREHLDRCLNSMVHDMLLGVVKESTAGLAVTEEDKEFLANFYRYAFVGLIMDWIAHDMRREPEEIVSRAAKLMEGEFRRAMERFATG